MNKPLRWLVLAPILLAASCVPKGSVPDGVYYVEDYHYFPEYRPVEPDRFVYGVRVTPQISAMLMWGPEFLWLFVINPTENEAVLEWTESSLLVDGQAESLLLVQEGFDCRRPETSPRQTVVPPNSHFQGYLLPASHIAWRQFAPDFNAAEYPPGYWGGIALQKLLNPHKPDLHSGYCERKDFFPLPSRARWDEEAQRAEVGKQVGRRLGLFLRFRLAGKEWSDRYEFEARRVVATNALQRCENQEGFNRFIREMRQSGDWRQVIKGMSLGECGYEYPTPTGEANE